jgi:two-component system, NtrC family, sensor kinase
VRLTAKLVAAWLVAIAILALLFGRRELGRQTAEFEARREASQQAVGRLFRPIIARTWRNEGEASAMYVVAYTRQLMADQHLDNELALRWVWLDRDAPASSSPMASLQALSAVLSGKEVTRHVADQRTGVERLVTYVPVALGMDPDRTGALEISSSLEPFHQFEAATRQRLFATIAIGVAALVILSGLIGAWVVARPVRRLVATARAIGDGDLSARVDLRQRDELGRLAGAMNGMADRLADAQDRVAQETEARIRALEQLRHGDRLSTLGRLASGVAHELGTPLAVISGRAQLLAEGSVGASKLQQYARSIEHQVERMSDIARQLTDFARRDTRKHAPHDMVALARDASDMMGALSTKARVQLEVTGGDAPAIAVVSPTQIQQVLSNLIVNAVQAMPTGGRIAVDVRVEAAAAPASSGPPRRWVCTRVTDTGPGIPRDVQERMFEPFFTTKRSGEGMGLGLAISQEIVLEHGGWIAVDSGPDRGTSFAIYLPEHAG